MGLGGRGIRDADIRDPLQLLPSLLKGKSPWHFGRTGGRLELVGDLLDDLLEVGVVSGEIEGGPIVPERFRQVASPIMDLGETAKGGKVLRGDTQDLQQLQLGMVELTGLDEGAPKRDAGGQVPRVLPEACTTDLDRLLEPASAAVLLGQLREGNRRRIPLHPSPEFLDPGVVWHKRSRTGPWRLLSDHWTVTALVTDPCCPTSSVTTSVTLYNPACANVALTMTPCCDANGLKSQS